MDDYVRLSELTRKERRELNRLVRRQKKRMNAPCMNCERRHFNCHATCHDYQQFRLKRDQAAEEKAKKDASMPEFCRKVLKQIWKDMKR